MGYCMDLMEHDFKIKKENIDKAYESLKEFMKTKDWLSWVTPSVVVNSKDFYEAFEEIRYPLTTDENGDFVLDYFAGEKLGKDKEILNSIAQYVENGSFIEFEGEDGDILRLEFENGECDWDIRSGDRYRD